MLWPQGVCVKISEASVEVRKDRITSSLGLEWMTLSAKAQTEHLLHSRNLLKWLVPYSLLRKIIKHWHNISQEYKKECWIKFCFIFLREQQVKIQHFSSCSTKPYPAFVEFKLPFITTLTTVQFVGRLRRNFAMWICTDNSFTL